MARHRTLALATVIVALCMVLLGCDRSLPPTHSLEVAAKGLHSGTLSEDSQLLVVGSIHHGGSFWRLGDEERLYNWNHNPEGFTTIVASDITRDGQWVITANPQTLVLWNTQSGTGERYWRAPGEILDIAIAPNANRAILGLSDHSAVIFNIQRGGVVHTFTHGNRVRSVDLSGDGRYAITGSEDATANLWEVRSGNKVTSFKHGDDVQLVKLSPDGAMALSVSKYDKALLWSTQKREIIGQLPLHGERLKRGLRFLCARFSADNTLLATGRSDRVVELWDVATLERISEWRLPKRKAWKPTGAAVLDVSFSPDRDALYALASNGFLHTLTIP